MSIKHWYGTASFTGGEWNTTGNLITSTQLYNRCTRQHLVVVKAACDYMCVRSEVWMKMHPKLHCKPLGQSLQHRWKHCWISNAKHLIQGFLIWTQGEVPKRRSCNRWTWMWIVLCLISSVGMLWQMPNVKQAANWDTHLRYNLLQGVN